MTGQSELVQSIAVPRDHRPLRIPSFPALERTSVLSFTDTFTLNTEATGLNTRIGVVRDPVFPVWRHFSTGAKALSVSRQALCAGITIVGGDPSFMDLDYREDLYSVDANSSGWPNVAQPLFVLNGVEFIPLIGDVVSLEMVCNTDPALSAWAVKGSYLDGNLDPISFIASGTWFGVVAGGVYHFHFSYELPDAAFAFQFESVSITATSAFSPVSLWVGSTTSNVVQTRPLTAPLATLPLAAMLPITLATEYSSAPIVWSSTRANAAAVLFSNVSAVMQKEGTVNCARAPSETGVNLFTSKMWDSQFSRIHPKERYFGPLEKGLYTFTLPDSTSESYHEYSDIGIGLPAFRHYLDGNRFAHLIIMKDPDNIAALAVTVDRHVEFKSNSVLFPYGFSATPLEAYHQAQMALANLGVFYENPVHLATIAALARSAIAKYGPRVAQAALPYAVRGANQLLSTINAKLGQMQQAGFTNKKEKTKTQKGQKKMVKTKLTIKKRRG